MQYFDMKLINDKFLFHHVFDMLLKMSLFSRNNGESKDFTAACTADDNMGPNSISGR